MMVQTEVLTLGLRDKHMEVFTYEICVSPQMPFHSQDHIHYTGPLSGGGVGVGVGHTFLSD